MNKLLEFVTRARKVLENDDVKRMYYGFYDFSHGSCMDASVLLGVLLAKHGFGEYFLTSTSINKVPTHSWLQNERHIIDITADQFVHWRKQELVLPRYPQPLHYPDYELSLKYC